MARSSLNRKVTINTGSISVSTTPPTEVAGTVAIIAKNTDDVIAAGFHRVEIENRGAENNSAHANISIGGFNIPPGTKMTLFETYIDEVNNRQVTSPAFSVTANGAYWVAVTTTN